MSDQEPRTGYSPHGTPISSLGITTSSSSEGVPVARPKRALHPVPAMPAPRGQSGSPARSRGSASERSSSTDTSSELRRLVMNQRLEAQFKVAQIELAMAEAREEEVLEQCSRRSNDSGRSRSSRGGGLNARALRELQDMSSMPLDSINRFHTRGNHRLSRRGFQA